MIYLYRLYQCVIMLPIMLVATILTAIATIIGSLAGFSRWWGYYPEVLWSRMWCWLAFVKVSVNGRENIDPSTSYVFVCNHQGAYDIFSIYGYLRHNFKWMMKASLRKIPFVGLACECSGQIYVDKSSPSALRHTMQRAERQLSDGMSLVVFPEGARTPDGVLHAFRRGAYTLADEFSLAVVPVTIDGSYKVMSRFAKLPHWGHIKLTIHKPIPTDSQGKHNLPELIRTSRDTIASALPENERGQ